MRHTLDHLAWAYVPLSPRFQGDAVAPPPACPSNPPLFLAFGFVAAVWVGFGSGVRGLPSVVLLRRLSAVVRVNNKHARIGAHLTLGEHVHTCMYRW